MTAYNAKHPYEPDWQIPRGVWANGPSSTMSLQGPTLAHFESSTTRAILKRGFSRAIPAHYLGEL